MVCLGCLCLFGVLFKGYLVIDVDVCLIFDFFSWLEDGDGWFGCEVIEFY